MEEQLQKLLDENEIRRLALRYAQTADGRDSAGFAALFAPGGILLGRNSRGGFEHSTPEQLANVPQLLNRFHATYHTVLNHLITFDANGAGGVVYCIAHHIQDDGADGLEDLAMTLTYHDRYVRSADAGWRFARRQVDLEWIQIQPIRSR